MDFITDSSEIQSNEISCATYSVSNFNNSFFENGNFFSISHLNIRSLKKNYDSFKIFYEDCLKTKFKIIAVSEIWCVADKDCYNLPGYSFEINPRRHGRGGGVGLYIHESLKYDVLNNYEISTAESLWVEVKFGKTVYLVGVLYRPPNTKEEDFINSLESTISSLSNKYNGCFIVGDLNIDLSIAKGDKLLEVFSCFNFEQLISCPTRVSKTSSSIIDHMYTNVTGKQITAGTVLTDISDHLPIFALFPTIVTPSYPSSFTMVRDYKKFQLQAFVDELKAESWEEVLNSQDVQLAYSRFISIFLTICNKHAPLVKRKVRLKRKQDKPWMTNAIKISIRKKHRLLQKLHKNSFNEHMFTYYKRYRNILTSVLRKAKKQYYADLLAEYKGNVKETWEVINDLLGKAKRKRMVLPDNLEVDIMGEKEAHSDINDIAEDFNSFFVHVGEKLASKIPPPSNVTFHTFLKNMSTNTFFLHPVSTNEIENLISVLDVRKATGWDNIPSTLVQVANSYISTPLCYIFNLSFTTGQFPDLMKVARVLPLYKKGNVNGIGNYRPISILPVLSKLLEKIVNTRIVNYLNKHNILYEHQYGFREKHSCKISLISLIQCLLDDIDSGNPSVGMFIDFSKAFDTVNHEILLSKLEHYGVRGLPLQWFKSYLNSRSQFVNIQNTESLKQEIKCGVPQGSILGPTLFLIYINDIPNSSALFNFRLFADDSNLFHSLHNNSNNISLTDINVEFQKVVKWCDCNKLTINADKTVYMVIGGKRNLKKVEGSIYLKDIALNEVDCTSFVGVTMDNQMRWKQHFVNVKKKICRLTGIFYKLRFMVPQTILVMLYNAFILPHISYGLEVWGSTFKTYFSDILVIQKRIVRIISGSSYDAHSAPLFKNLKIIDVYIQFKLQVAIFVYDVIHGNLPMHFK